MLARDPSGKAIVFSQFTSMLDLAGFRLEQVGGCAWFGGGGRGPGRCCIRASLRSCVCVLLLVCALACAWGPARPLPSRPHGRLLGCGGGAARAAGWKRPDAVLLLPFCVRPTGSMQHTLARLATPHCTGTALYTSPPPPRPLRGLCASTPHAPTPPLPAPKHPVPVPARPLPSCSTLHFTLKSPVHAIAVARSASSACGWRAACPWTCGSA